MSDVPVTAMQTSFAGGELSPTLYGRVDLDKYHIGLAVARNVFVDYRGGVTNRPGTRLVGRAISTAFRSRLIPFTFSNVQTYILEFSDHLMRVIRNGGYVTEPTKAISFSAGTYTSTAHGYSTGDWVFLIDKVPWAFVTVIDANHFSLTDFNSNPVVSASPTAARIYTLVTPWAAADLLLLKFTQSFDTMTLVHPNYQPYDLTRTQHWVWILTAVTLAASIVNPTITAINVSLTGTAPPNHDTGYGYQVTAVSATGEESNPSTMVSFQSFDMAAFPATYTVQWGSIAGADHYNIYRTPAAYNAAIILGTNTGYVGYSTGTSFFDSNTVPDFTKTPPTHTNPFASSNYPGVTAYFDQCKIYAGSNLNPQTMWMSQPAQFKNFDVSNPANDGDALTLTLATTQASLIKSLVPMPGGLVILTTSGIFQATGGGQYEGIKVSSALARQQSFGGANDVPPIPLNNEILYIQSKGSIVRSLVYNLYTSTYQPDDLTLFSNHLFWPHNIVEWAYAEQPHKLVWAVRDDGQLLSLAYVKDQKIAGWTRHDTFGLVESIASVQENNVDAVYISVRRFINGQWVRFVEQLQSKDISMGVENAWYVDCGLDTGLTYLAAGITVSGVTGTQSVLADASVFNSGMAGSVFRAGGGVATVSSYSSPTAILVTFTRDIVQIINDGVAPMAPPFAVGQWSLTAPVTTISGLDHLAGMSVSILADGKVQPTQAVSSTGVITLAAPATRVIIGLPFQSQCATLNLEPSSVSVQGKRKKIVANVARVVDTGPLRYGPNFDELVLWTDSDNKLINGIMTGDQPLGLNQYYDYGGQVCWQQNDPMPMTVVSLVPELSVGD